MGLAPPPPRASACWKISSGASCLIITMFLAGERREAVGEGRFLGCSGTDPLRWALALVADLAPFHLLDAGAASCFLMPSTFAAFLTSGPLTHRSAP